MYFFARLKIDLQIGIFGIIAQDSDFPEIALQNCKSDMTTPLRGICFERTKLDSDKRFCASESCSGRNFSFFPVMTGSPVIHKKSFFSVISSNFND
jgi:hypothetical protein